MYQALYRKYRPKVLEDICGQETIVRIMKNSIEKNKINHAYLFAGPRGTGKTSLAKVFSKIVNCENLVDAVPCGKCVNCTQKNTGDIVEIDAASNNGVDEIRELRNKVSLVPSYGKYKIYIIDEVHMLTTGAFNALLKTLEEPPPHIIFILATTDPHKIPETIISRCQKLDFKKISVEAIVKRLKKISELENIKVEENALREIAILSDGGMRDSLGMLDEASNYTNDIIRVKDIHDINGTLTLEELRKLVVFISDGQIEKILEYLDYANSSGKNFVKLTEELVLFMRNLLMLKKAPKYFTSINSDVSVFESIDFEPTELINSIEMLNECILNMKNTNSPKLMLELNIIKMISGNKKYKSIPIIEKSNLNKINNVNSAENNKNVITELKEEIKITHDTNKLTTNQESQLLDSVTENNNIDVEKLENLKQIRVNNTLSRFNKKNMILIKEKVEQINDYLFDSDYSKSASILLDGELRAASDENMIFVYKTENYSKLFNENLILLEKLIEKIYLKHYKLISVNQKEWEEIKKEFNGKLRNFIYEEEKIKLEDIFSSKKDEIISLFSDIIEYS